MTWQIKKKKTLLQRQPIQDSQGFYSLWVQCQFLVLIPLGHPHFPIRWLHGGTESTIYYFKDKFREDSKLPSLPQCLSFLDCLPWGNQLHIGMSLGENQIARIKAPAHSHILEKAAARVHSVTWTSGETLHQISQKR